MYLSVLSEVKESIRKISFTSILCETPSLPAYQCCCCLWWTGRLKHVFWMVSPRLGCGRPVGGRCSMASKGLCFLQAFGDGAGECPCSAHREVKTESLPAPIIRQELEQAILQGYKGLVHFCGATRAVAEIASWPPPLLLAIKQHHYGNCSRGRTILGEAVCIVSSP